MRQMFCHEEELIRQFSRVRFGFTLTHGTVIVADHVWGEQFRHTRGIGCFNVNFRTTVSESAPTNVVTRVMQIHPGYLNPAVFLMADMDTGSVRSLELLGGEQLQPRDYPKALSQIRLCMADLPAESRWNTVNFWRVFAMFDRLFFLMSILDDQATFLTSRREFEMPLDVPGECAVLVDDGEPVGLEGWFEHPTGFGTKALV